MSHGVLEDDGIDYKIIASQRIDPFLHDLCENCKKHPSVTFVSTTPGDIRKDPRTKSAIHRLSARIAALEEAESLIRRERLVAEEELAFCVPVSHPFQHAQMRLLPRYWSSHTPRRSWSLRILPKHY
jgi:hypothetical protein